MSHSKTTCCMFEQTYPNPLDRKTCSATARLVLFPRKIFFERKKFNSVVRVVLLTMTCRVQVCRVGVLYNTSVECYSGSEGRVGDFEARY